MDLWQTYLCLEISQRINGNATIELMLRYSISRLAVWPRRSRICLFDLALNKSIELHLNCARIRKFWGTIAVSLISKVTSPGYEMRLKLSRFVAIFESQISKMATEFVNKLWIKGGIDVNNWVKLQLEIIETRKNSLDFNF